MDTNTRLVDHLTSPLLDMKAILEEVEIKNPEMQKHYDKLELLFEQIKYEAKALALEADTQMLPKDVFAYQTREDSDNLCYLCENDAKWQKNEVQSCDECIWMAPYHIDYL